jgi:cytokinin dehydrogenase
MKERAAMVGTEREAVGRVAHDFGNLARGEPLGVVQPASEDEVLALVREACSSGERLTVRGVGHSFGGQSLPARSVVLDMSRLNGVEPIDGDRAVIRCGAGATLREVVAATLPHGWLPKVLTNLLDLTVGGLLSVGGIGPGSQRFGPIVSNVRSMVVVTGRGEMRRCSRSENRRLYDAMLCGLGRCGIIVSAELELRPTMPHVRTFYLLYDDHRRWLGDQQALAGSVHGMEGFCSPNAQGLRGTGGRRAPFVTWFYPLQLAVEYDKGPLELPAELSPYRVVHVEDDLTKYFPTRHDVRFETMKRLGAWERPHPTVSAFIDAQALAEVLPDVLDEIPLGLGDAHRGIFFVNDTETPPLFMTPATKNVAFFSIMHAGVSPPLVQEALEAFSRARDKLQSAGGKTYLADWLGEMSPTRWAAHFGPKIDGWQSDKSLFDPDDVFCSQVIA